MAALGSLMPVLVNSHQFLNPTICLDEVWLCCWVQMRWVRCLHPTWGGVSKQCFFRYLMVTLCLLCSSLLGPLLMSKSEYLVWFVTSFRYWVIQISHIFCILTAYQRQFSSVVLKIDFACCCFSWWTETFFSTHSHLLLMFCSLSLWCQTPKAKNQSQGAPPSTDFHKLCGLRFCICF